jgi:hypothetical protein
MTSPEWKQALQLRASAQAEIALHEQRCGAVSCLCTSTRLHN